MATRHTLRDLRNSIQEIHRQAMLERSDGEAANAAILARVKAEKPELLLQLTPELVNIALTKLLNEVSTRKGQRTRSTAGPDLFGDYRVPRSVSIVRGKKKDTAKLSVREAELYLQAHSEKSASDRHASLRLLLEECRQFMRSPEDTLETLFLRKEQANKLAFA